MYQIYKFPVTTVNGLQYYMSNISCDSVQNLAAPTMTVSMAVGKDCTAMPDIIGESMVKLVSGTPQSFEDFAYIVASGSFAYPITIVSRGVLLPLPDPKPRSMAEWFVETKNVPRCGPVDISGYGEYQTKTCKRGYIFIHNYHSL